MARSTVFNCATVDGDSLDVRSCCADSVIELIFTNTQSDVEESLLDLERDKAVQLGRVLCSFDPDLKELLDNYYEVR